MRDEDVKRAILVLRQQPTSFAQGKVGLPRYSELCSCLKGGSLCVLLCVWFECRALCPQIKLSEEYKLEIFIDHELVRSYFLVFVPTIREIRDFYREM
eukprot:SAG31_NODE_750_length_12362_cov_6.912827_4_plen_98_part_00